jgi:hypothetical protein
VVVQSDNTSESNGHPTRGRVGHDSAYNANSTTLVPSPAPAPPHRHQRQRHRHAASATTAHNPHLSRKTYSPITRTTWCVYARRKRWGPKHFGMHTWPHRCVLNLDRKPFVCARSKFRPYHPYPQYSLFSLVPIFSHPWYPYNWTRSKSYVRLVRVSLVHEPNQTKFGSVF